MFPPALQTQGTMQNSRLVDCELKGMDDTNKTVSSSQKQDIYEFTETGACPDSSHMEFKHRDGEMNKASTARQEIICNCHLLTKGKLIFSKRVSQGLLTTLNCNLYGSTK